MSFLVLFQKIASYFSLVVLLQLCDCKCFVSDYEPQGGIQYILNYISQNEHGLPSDLKMPFKFVFRYRAK